MADNVSLVEQAYEAFGRGDVETVVALFDDDLEWFEAENSTFWTGRALHGPSEVVQGVFARLAAETTDFRLAIGRVSGCGDTVLVEGRHLGTWNATRTAIDFQFAHVWDLRDGRAVRWQQYTDTLGWARATGDLG